MKIIITGLHGSGKEELVNLLKEEGYKIGQLFSNLKDNKFNSVNYKYFDDIIINEIFDNKAYMYIKQIKNTKDLNIYYEGISKYDWDNNDIFVLSPDVITELNQFSSDVLYVWLDNTWKDRYNRWKEEKREYNFDELEKYQSNYKSDFYDRMYNSKNTNVLYFSNEDNKRIKTILKTFINYPDMQSEIIKNFN